MIEICILWVFIYALRYLMHYYSHSKHKIPSSPPSSPLPSISSSLPIPPSSSCHLHAFYLSYDHTHDLHASSSSFLSFHQIETRIKSSSLSKRLLSLLFSIGSFFLLLFLLISPLLLLFLLSNLQISEGFSIIKDEHEEGMSSLVIPLVPFLNIPRSYLLSFTSATLLSAFLHEIGHALAAVLENIRIESIGIYLFLLFPGAYVQIEANSFSSLTFYPKLRILSGGITFNLLLFLLSAIIYQTLPLLLILFYTRSKGVVITSISPLSNLNIAFQQGQIITAVNGEETRANSAFKELLMHLEVQNSKRKMEQSTRLFLLDKFDSSSSSSLEKKSVQKFSDYVHINTGYCIRKDLPIFLKPVRDIYDTRNTSSSFHNSTSSSFSSFINRDCCVHLLSGNFNSRVEESCFLHTPTRFEASFELVCENIRTVYHPSTTHFGDICDIDSDCKGSLGDFKCLKLVSPMDTQLILIERSLSQRNSQRTLQRNSHAEDSFLYFQGSAKQIISDTKMSSFRLRSWLYNWLGIHEIEWLHSFFLSFRSYIVMYLKLLMQVNLSSAFMNSLPIAQLDGAQVLIHLLKIFLPK